MKTTLQAALLLLATTLLLVAVLFAPRTARAVVPTADAAIPAIAVVASVPASEAPREIAALLALLRASDCRFERNGRWHDGARAAEHLQRKLDYAVGRRMRIGNTEQFIAAAATRSSFSGRPYHVQCGDGPRQPAAAWFHARLKELRTH